MSGCSTTGPAEKQKTAFTSPKYEKARILMEGDQHKDAIPLLQEVNKSRPDLVEPYINLGIAYRNNEQLDEALKALEQAVQLGPDNPASFHQLGILYREMGMFDESLAAYSKSLKLDRDYALAHRNVGILYDLYLQRPDQALDHYKKYLELASEPDKQVNGWVIDLERRTGSARAKVSQ
jgi:tetratricopeptide (TPR) repeat protein